MRGGKQGRPARGGAGEEAASCCCVKAVMTGWPINSSTDEVGKGGGGGKAVRGTLWAGPPGGQGGLCLLQALGSRRCNRLTELLTVVG